MPTTHTAPWGLDARYLPCVGAPAPRNRTLTALPTTIDDWRETFGFQMSVINAQIETHVLRLLYGPWRLDQLYISQSGADGRNVHTYLTDDDNNAEPTAVPLGPARVPRFNTTDATDPTPSLSTNVAAAIINPGFICRRGTSRIAIICDNAAAATVSVWGSVTITHLIETACPSEHPRYT